MRSKMPEIGDNRISCILSVRRKPFVEEYSGYEVVGYPVHIPGYEEFLFAVHPSAMSMKTGELPVSCEEFSVSELSSGRRFAGGRSIEEAVLDAQRRLIDCGVTPEVLRSKIAEVTATQA